MRSVVSAPVLIWTKWTSGGESIPASSIARRTPSAATLACTLVPNSSGSRSRVYAVPTVKRFCPRGAPREQPTALADVIRGSHPHLERLDVHTRPPVGVRAGEARPEDYTRTLSGPGEPTRSAPAAGAGRGASRERGRRASPAHRRWLRRSPRARGSLRLRRCLWPRAG